MNSTPKDKDQIDHIFYRFVIDNLPVGILTVDPQMKVMTFNPWAETLTGYSATEAMGRYCGDLLQGGMCKVNCPLERAIDSGEPLVRMETTIRRKDGKIIPVRMHAAALLDSSGRLIGAVEAFQDVSPLKTMERERSNIISMFAHDMKSSLTIIGGFVLRLLKKRGELDDEKQKRYLRVIQKETDKLDFLVKDFLEFARLQTGELKLNFQATSLDKELMELYDAYQSRSLQEHIGLELQNDEVLPVILADPDRLRRVFSNLLDNAFKFSREGGKITISAEETPGEVIISIKDEGQGIDPEEIPFIFDIFHRGKDAGRIPGSGIGLAFVKAIVEGHGGEVLVESEPGRGSTFKVKLPKRRSPD
ncbi:MAG: PAS domain-containing sensor histidine kinase [Deltaproteobacteria bacterium]|nr:PAS domain-containing sensor histidine kinase [Deltaproteobacteria bacterium]